MVVKARSAPHESGVYRGLAQAPLHLQNMVAELVDNALAAKPSGFEIRVDLSPAPEGGDLYRLRVWDNGPGISLSNLETAVFVLGEPPDSTSHLNEHGFGLKNVLAKAEQLTNHPWSFRTRDEDALNKKVFYETTRPLTFAQEIFDDRKEQDWPEWGPKETGTIVEIPLPLSYLQSVALGRRGGVPNVLSTIMSYLREHLGVFYRGYLEAGVRAEGRILTSQEMGEPDPVESVSPDYRTKEAVPFPPIHIGGSKITIEGEIGLVLRRSPKTKQRLYYYRHAPDSQGVDIRIGDRVVATRLISEIWERERHPTLNGVAGEFKVPPVKDAFPPTLNNKTSLDFDSQIWQAISSAIRQAVPKEEIPYGGGKSEDDLRDELYQQIEGLKKPDHVVEKEYDCGHGVFVDIYWDQRKTGGGVDIYEVKKGKAQVLDVYQVVMYWDALVSVGVQPTQGHLVSNGVTSGVGTFIQLMETRQDANGENYDIVSESWDQHVIKP